MMAALQFHGGDPMGLTGPVARKVGRYFVENFTTQIQEHLAVYPTHKTSNRCSRLKKQGRCIDYRLEWSAHCLECPLRADAPSIS